jgi:hypothetical protein
VNHPAAISASSITAPSSGFLLSRLHLAYVRTRIALNEIEFAGRALSGGLVDTLGALELLNDAGLLPLIEASS